MYIVYQSWLHIKFSRQVTISRQVASPPTFSNLLSSSKFPVADQPSPLPAMATIAQEGIRCLELLVI